MIRLTKAALNVWCAVNTCSNTESMLKVLVGFCYFVFSRINVLLPVLNFFTYKKNCTIIKHLFLIVSIHAECIF